MILLFPDNPYPAKYGDDKVFERHDGVPGALRWLAPLSVSHTAMPRRHPILDHRKSRTSRYNW